MLSIKRGVGNGERKHTNENKTKLEKALKKAESELPNIREELSQP